METISCDFCGNATATILYQFDDPIKNIKNRFNYVECENCHLIYLNPRPNKLEILDYYPEDYAPYQRNINDEKNALVKFMRSYNVSRKRLWIENKTKIRNGVILDVGCSTGIFLNEMRNNGWEAVGVEISSYASEYAKNIFGLKIINAPLEETKFDAKSFDIITYWDVLEHTYSPTQQLKISNKILKKDGFLVINIPNWNSFDKKLLKNFWVGYDPPRHLFIFIDHSFKKILNQYGFEIINKQCFISSYYGFVISIDNWLSSKNKSLAKKVKRIFLFPGIRFLFQPVLSIINLLGNGTVVTYIVQKKREVYE